MTKTRGFEKIKTEENNNEFNLPTRATKTSAGYDFEASKTTIIPSIPTRVADAVKTGGWHGLTDVTLFKPTLVPTGVKAYMKDDEYLQLANRSSNPLKRFLLLANGVGVIDADYYSNDSNDGHIMFQFINFGLKDVVIQPGEKIGQGIFHKFLKADNGNNETTRVGGFGSTDE